jgi:hypothetical protein
VRYIRIGTEHSREELLAVARAAEGDRKDQVAEFLTSVAEAERIGFGAERKLWDQVIDGKILRMTAAWQEPPEDEDRPPNGVFIYAGSKPKRGERSIWAAVDVADHGSVLTLLKIVDTYTGGNAEEHDLLADALDRQQRGERVL